MMVANRVTPCPRKVFEIFWSFSDGPGIPPITATLGYDLAMLMELTNVFSPLFAVHLSDGVLTMPFSVAGMFLATLIVGLGLAGIEDREIPRMGVLTAAFFVASQVHLPLGITSVHLLLNGLLAVILGPRAVVAIAVGLGLQALLFAHGGMTSLGVNICIYAIPSLLAAFLFRTLRRWRGLQRWFVQSIFIFLVVILLLATIVVAGLTIILKRQGGSVLTPELLLAQLNHPLVVCCILLLAAVLTTLFRRLDPNAEFAIGALVGAVTAYLTVVLVAMALMFGGAKAWNTLPWVVLLWNSPVIAVEAIGLGFVVRYLGRVKPEWLGAAAAHRAGSEDSDSGKISANGISH